MQRPSLRSKFVAAAAALGPVAVLAGCANPIYHATGSDPHGHRPDANTAAAMQGAWGGELESWTSGSPAPVSTADAQPTEFPAPSGGDTRDLGWGRTSPGDTGTARTVAPGSTGAGVRAATDPSFQSQPYAGNPPSGMGDTPVVEVMKGATGAVPGQEPGTVTTMNTAPRGVDTGASRPHLFDQFGRLQEDRDALRQQVTALQAELERMQVESQQRAEIEERSQLETANLRAQIERLEEVNRQLSRENEDLAGRLLTAQIRRLEAEKALLENLIAAEQAGALPPSLARGAGAPASQPGTQP